MRNPFQNLQHLRQLEATCPLHNIPLVQLDRAVKVVGEDKPRKLEPFCPECEQEQKQQQEQRAVEEHLNAGLYSRTYNVLMRDSTIPRELEGASFNTFKAETAEEKQLLEFARGQVEKYTQGMTGNTLITGQTGIGKSHLS
ncbi:ATP-binding protein, partial [Streptococcus suis]